MKNCKQCGEVKPLDDFNKTKANKDGHHSYCRVCHNATSRHWREDNKERANATIKRWKQEHPEVVSASKARYAAKNPLKKRAQSAVNHAIRDGKLLKPTECSECNATGTIQAHHCDYSKPLEVMWLCQICHIDWHKEHGTDLNGEAA